MPQQTQLHSETGKIRLILARKGVEISFWPHALEEMTKDDLDLLDIRHALRGGYVVGHEPHMDCWRHTVLGRSLDGDNISVVVLVRPQDAAGKIGDPENAAIEVVTVWKNKK